MNKLWFVTGYSLIDVWTIVHLCFWVFVGSCLWSVKTPKDKAMIYCIVLSYLWEMFEYFIAFRFFTDLWLDKESWYNSLISDPLMCMIGVSGIWWLLDNREVK